MSSSTSTSSSSIPIKTELTEERRKQIIEQCKNEKWNTLYPAYFDKSKSLEQGRKVPKQLAVEKPTAYGIWNACLKLGYSVVLQVDNKKPSDQFNEGRVKILIPGIRESTQKSQLSFVICFFFVIARVVIVFFQEKDVYSKVASSYATLSQKETELPKEYQKSEPASPFSTNPQATLDREKKKADKKDKKEEKKKGPPPAAQKKKK